MTNELAFGGLVKGFMSNDERVQWDRRYTAGEYRPRKHTSHFFEEWLPVILGSGSRQPRRALDVATGAGRHALRLAEAGFEVDAVDISAVALDLARDKARDRGLHVNWQVADLDDLRFDHDYDLITVFRYRNEQLWPRLIDALEPNGWVLVEHHLKTEMAVDGPRPEAFLVRPGELLQAFGSLRIVYYAESIEPGDRGSDTTYAMVRLAACKGDPGW